MAWIGLTLTVDGRNALNQAQTNNRMNFRSVVVGDGQPPSNYGTQKHLVHQLFEIETLKIDQTEDGYDLTVDLPEVDFDYYFREIGVIVETDNGEKLYVYDNCGEDAQYIVSTTGAETVQKRIRLSLYISDVENITVVKPSVLYVDYNDFEQEQAIREIMDTELQLTIQKETKRALEAEQILRLEKIDKVEGMGLSANDYTNADKKKLKEVEDRANNYIHPNTHPASMIVTDATHRFVTDNQVTGWDGIYQQSTGYTDKKIADLINGAPETLDTLKEVADAISENETVVDALNASIGTKANQNEVDGHTENSNIHVTPSEKTAWGNKLASNGDGSNLTEIFLQASALANIVSGESHRTIFGKIAKAIADYITHKTAAATASALGHVKVDSAMSSSSTNPVQNKAVNAALSGKLATTGDAGNTTVTFTEATAMTELASGEKQSTLFGKLKLTVKNVISILKLLGSTDISGIGDGTVTGAISGLNSNLTTLFKTEVCTTSITNIPKNATGFVTFTPTIPGGYRVFSYDDSVNVFGLSTEGYTYNQCLYQSFIDGIIPEAKVARQYIYVKKL